MPVSKKSKMRNVATKLFRVRVRVMNKKKAELSQSQPISLNKLGMCGTLQDDDEQAVWACPEYWQIN